MPFRQDTATLPGGSGPWNSCNALPHCLGHWAVGLSQCTASLPRGNGQGELLHCTASLLGSVGSATRAMHCYTAWGRRAMELLQRVGPSAGGTESRAQESVDPERANLLQCTATLPGGSRQWNSCHALPGCLKALSCAIPAMHCLTAWAVWAVELLQRTASPPWGCAEWYCCNAVPHCSGAQGS